MCHDSMSDAKSCIASAGHGRCHSQLAVALVVAVFGGVTGLVVGLAAQTPHLSSNVMARVAPQPGPSSARGPQATITCPAAAINVWPGTNLQSAVNAYPSGTSFCLKAGLHAIRYRTVPKSGNTFTGEYGAILDGSTWPRASTGYEEAAFQAFLTSQPINDVTFRNLECRNMPRSCFFAYYEHATRWTFDHVLAHHNGRWVANIPSDSVLSNSVVHNNLGVSSKIPGDTGGAFAVFRATNVQVINNEFYGNGSEGKVTHAFNVVIRGNYFHNETHNAVWFDGDSPGSVVEDNLIDDATIFGVFLEVAQRIIVRHNTIRRAGWNAISLHTSRETEIYENTIEDAGSIGISLRMECNRGGVNGGGELANKWDLTNNVIRDNTLRVLSGGSAGGLLVDQSITPCAERAAYLSNAKNNRWIRNRYNVPRVTGAYWSWAVLPAPSLTLAEWRALGQDMTGTVQ